MKNLRLLLVLVLASFAFQPIDAQPSIPRTRSTPLTATKSTRDNRVWGTGYDWLSTRYATYNDIRYLDGGQIRVLKNSIYARLGRKFKDANLRAYFNSCSWYVGWRNEVPSREMNKYEKANIQFLKKYEY